MVEVRITYETLFDLLRKEKSRNELQDLEQTFFVDVVSYLKDKSSTVDQSSSRAEQEKIKIQLKNIHRILKELYELREKKILNLAMNKVRTNSDLIDTSKMLLEEKKLFDESVVLLKDYKHNVLLKILNFELPTVDVSASVQIAPESDDDEEDEAEQEEEKEPKVQDEEPVQEKKVETENKDDSYIPESGNVKVKFLSSLPKFMGLDKNAYGPYEKGSIDEIPSSVAELLKKKGRIELVN